MNYEDEKRSPVTTKPASSLEQSFDENLHEPPPEESLHRGLKARQISMIAVRCSPLQRNQNLRVLENVARRSCRNWSHHWIRYRAQERWSTRYGRSTFHGHYPLTLSLQVSSWVTPLWASCVIWSWSPWERWQPFYPIRRDSLGTRLVLLTPHLDSHLDGITLQNMWVCLIRFDCQQADIWYEADCHTE